MKQPPNTSLTTSFLECGTLTFQKQEIIHTSDAERASVFLLCDGFVKSYTITPDGDLNILSFYGTNALFPLSPALRGDGARSLFGAIGTVYFEAMTDVTVSRRSAQAFRDILNSKPIFYRELTYRLVQNYQVYLSRSESMQYRSAHQRIAHHLLTLADLFGRKQGRKVVLDLPLTHQDLAESLGVARETVSRAVEKLKKDGLLDSSSKHFILKNPDKLRAILE